MADPIITEITKGTESIKKERKGTSKMVDLGEKMNTLTNTLKKTNEAWSKVTPSVVGKVKEDKKEIETYHKDIEGLIKEVKKTNEELGTQLAKDVDTVFQKFSKRQKINQDEANKILENIETNTKVGEKGRKFFETLTKTGQSVKERFLQSPSQFSMGDVRKQAIETGLSAIGLGKVSEFFGLGERIDNVIEGVFEKLRKKDKDDLTDAFEPMVVEAKKQTKHLAKIDASEEKLTKEPTLREKKESISSKIKESLKEPIGKPAPGEGGILSRLLKGSGGLSGLLGKAGMVAGAGAAGVAAGTIANKGINKLIEKGTGEKGATLGGKLYDWTHPGQVSEQYESGKRGTGAISSGKGDAGGKSYGKYQLSLNKGTLQKFLLSSGYADQFQGLTPGSPEFDAAWKRMAKDPNFQKAESNFIASTHYAPQMKDLSESGINLSGRGKAVQEAVFSTSVQYGGKTDIIKKALKDKDVSEMSDEEIISAIQDKKRDTTGQYFKKSSPEVQRAQAKRAVKEKETLLALNRAPIEGESVDTTSLLAKANKTSTQPTTSTMMPVPVPEGSREKAPKILGVDDYEISLFQNLIGA